MQCGIQIVIGHCTRHDSTLKLKFHYFDLLYNLTPVHTGDYSRNSTTTVVGNGDNLSPNLATVAEFGAENGD